MSAYQDVFQRYEKKYLLSGETYRRIRALLEEPMQADAYGQHTICNLYFDTPDYQLIRASLERPVYKEKLRLRSYGAPGREDRVYAELKKKYRGVVYKRRAALTYAQAEGSLMQGAVPPGEGQIFREIAHFLRLYQPLPRVYIAYDRVALFGRDNPAMRVTFDSRIRCRSEALDLAAGPWGEALLPPDTYLMEIKIPGAMPLWMSRLLDKQGLYPTSFSKYGAYYQRHPWLPTQQTGRGGIRCA